MGALGLGRLGGRLLLVDPLADHLRLLHRQQGLAPDVLGQRRDVAVVDQLDPVELAVDVARGQLLADLAGVGEGGPVGEADVGRRSAPVCGRSGRRRPCGRRRRSRARRRRSRSSAPRRMPSRMMFVLKAPARPRSPVISRTPDPFFVLALFEHRHAGDAAGVLGRPAGQPPHPLRVGAQRLDPLFGAAQPRRRHHLHRPRDLVDVLDRGDAVLDFLLGGHGELGGSRLLLLGGLAGPLLSRAGAPSRAPRRT